MADFPSASYIDKELEDKMDIAQQVVYLTRSMRAKANLKVRQPLKKIMIAVPNEKKEAVINMKDVILDEVNIKELEVLQDDSGIVSKSAKANFKVLGPKYGKLMKSLAKLISEFGKEDIIALEKGTNVTLTVDGEEAVITKADVEIISTEIEGWVVESNEGVTVAVDSELTEELIAEGYAREIVNRIQNMRKDSGLDVVDRIKVFVKSESKISDYVNQFVDYIKTETLTDSLEFRTNNNEGFTQSWSIGDYDCDITIKKLGN